MSHKMLDPRKWNSISTASGGILWLLAVFVSWSGWLMLEDLELLLLLAIFVIVPLALPLVLPLTKDRRFQQFVRILLYLQPLAAVIGGSTFLPHVGPLAGAFAVIWFLFTILLSLVGFFRLHWLARSLPNTCLTAALFYLPVGGAWMVLARLGLQPLGFGVHTDLLTALHFHFISLAALIITGLTGQFIQTSLHTVNWSIYRIAALGALINPLLVATGLTTAQITGIHYMDTVPAELLALSLIMIALLGLRFIVPKTASWFARGLLLLSYTAVFFTMLIAGTYAMGIATRAWTITLSQMIMLHGIENVLLFGLCGLLGWRLRVGQEKR